MFLTRTRFSLFPDCCRPSSQPSPSLSPPVDPRRGGSEERTGRVLRPRPGRQVRQRHRDRRSSDPALISSFPDCRHPLPLRPGRWGWVPHGCLTDSVYILFFLLSLPGSPHRATEAPPPGAVPRLRPVGPVPTVLTVRRPIPTAHPLGLHGLPIPIPGFRIGSWLQNSLL